MRKLLLCFPFVLLLLAFAPTAHAQQLIADAEAIFSGVRGTVSASKKPLVLTNKGTAPLRISALSITGAHAAAFTWANMPALPLTIAAGGTYTLGVQFAPPTTIAPGALNAVLTITSNDPQQTTVIGLYGLSARAEQGSSEPPLDAVVKTLGYNINVGGTSLVLSTGPAAIGDEVLQPLFQKAGNGPVQMKPVARYSPDDLLAFGYYTKNNGLPVVKEIGKVALDQEQSLLPLVTAGSQTSFDPGTAVFGFFTGATSYARQNTYTEDHLNTGPLPHSARIYPIKDRSGLPVANSYLVCFEPASNGDYQDYVFEVSNVQPVPGTDTETSVLLEAELALLSGAVKAANRAGFSGSGFADYVNNSGDFVEWTVERSTSDSVALLFRYANAGAGSRPLKLEVNGVVVNAGLNFPSTGDWTNWMEVSAKAQFKAGTNKIRLTATGASGPNIDYLKYTIIPSLPQGGILEAEHALLDKAVVAANQSGYSGSGFADFINNSGDFIEWTINKGTDGFASLQFRYANGSTGNRPLRVDINGVEVHAGLIFPPTGTWNQWSEVGLTANLAAGINKVRMTAIGSSGANIDYLNWEAVSAVPSGILEAEAALLSGAVKAANRAGFSGSGFADYVNNSGDFVEWTVERSTSDSVALLFRYANAGAGSRPLKLEVNGVVVNAGLNFPSTGDWTNWMEVSAKAQFKAGTNKIRLTATGASGPNIDYLNWKLLSTASGTQVAVRDRELPLIPADRLAVSLQPNPARDRVEVRIPTDSSTPVRLLLTDATGRVYKQFSYTAQPSGSYGFSVAGLSSGIYFLLVQQGNSSTSVSLMVQGK